MIEGQDIRPERKLYYLGSLLLDILKGSEQKKLDYLYLYDELCKREKVSVALFTFALDWLFILRLIEGNGRFIKKCF